MDEDWDSDGEGTRGMEGLSLSEPGFSVGKGRGYIKNSMNGDNFSVGAKLDKENNFIDDWVEEPNDTYETENNINSSWGQNYSNGGGNSHKTKGCFKCGDEGHISRDCPNNGGRGGGGGGSGSRSCFKCGEEGHMSRDCSNNGGGMRGGGSNRSCFKCGEEGHMSRDCSNNGGGMRGGGSNRGCFKCGEEGHMSRDCSNNSGGMRGGGSNRGCFKCGEEGHMSRDCSNNSGGMREGSSNRGCFKCGENGHMARECPNEGYGNGGGNRGCFKCGEEGHISRDCPNGGYGGGMGGGGGGGMGGGGGNRSCYQCGEEGHMSRDCTNGGGTGGPGDKPAPSTYEPVEVPNDENHLFETGIYSGIHFDKYDNIPVKMSGNNLIRAISSFSEARFSNLVIENIRRAQYSKPTPIQKCAIPIILQGRDLMGCAQTGSGKTAAFLLPIIEYLLKDNVQDAEYTTPQQPFAIIVAPTRELAIQIHTEARKFSFKTNVRSVVTYGGTAVQFQLSNLMNGCHILVATPGRLMDFINRKKIEFENLKFLVLDEADRMLDMGFITDIRKLCAYASSSPGGHQTLMFSATFPEEVQQLASEFLNDYIFLAIGQVGSANSDVKQTVYQVGQFEKRQKLVDILSQSPNDRTLVFVEKKRTADFLATYLCQEKFRTTSIHGDRPQREREEAIADFRSGRMPILTATAVAARGLDIKGVEHVINYDLPTNIEEYVHRIGRTGRVGNEGRATSFFDASSNSPLAAALVKVLSDSLQEVPDWLHESIDITSSMMSGAGRMSSRGGFGAKDVRNAPNMKPYEMSQVQSVVTCAPEEEDWN